MDHDRMIAAIVKQYAVRLDRDDPTFLVVELNRLALEESIAPVLSSIDAMPRRVEKLGLIMAKTLVSAFAAQHAAQLAKTRAAVAEEVGATCRKEVAEAARRALAVASKASRARMAYCAVTALLLAALAFGVGYLSGGASGSPPAACSR
jgi:hypothetical protein